MTISKINNQILLLTMNPKSNLLIAILTIVGCFLLLAMHPVPAEAVQNVSSITGKIVKVAKEGDLGDVKIKLKNDHRTYYLNGGTDNGLTIKMLKSNLLYRQVSLDLVERWSPLDPASKRISVAQVSVSGQVYWKQPASKVVIN